MGENQQHSWQLFDGRLTVQMQWALDQLVTRPNMTPQGYFTHDADAPGLTIQDASHASKEQIKYNPEAIGVEDGSPQAFRREPSSLYTPDHTIHTPKIYAATRAPIVEARRAPIIGVQRYQAPVIGIKEANPSQTNNDIKDIIDNGERAYVTFDKPPTAEGWKNTYVPIINPARKDREILRPAA
jgi:hypothetical protein